MLEKIRGRTRLVTSAVVASLAVGLAPSAAAAPDPVVPIVIVGQPSVIFGVNQGLPPLSPTEDYEAGPELAPVITAYRDSGRYQGDQRAVARAAQAFLRSWLHDNCQSMTRCGHKKSAVVFDIDDTLVDWYPTYASTNFIAVPELIDDAVVNCLTPAIAPVRSFLHYAQRHGIPVFLISGRGQDARSYTASCLNRRGISGWAGLVLRAPDQETMTAEQFKSQARGAIEQRGYRIVTSIGDQLSDSTGGFLVRGFRLPNPMYYIA